MTNTLKPRPLVTHLTMNDSPTGLTNTNDMNTSPDIDADSTIPAAGVARPDQLDPDSSPSDNDVADELPVELPAARRPVARCADGNGTLNALFFSDHVADIARAKAICGLCPLQTECLADALEREEPWGVWGGELISGGRVIANKRACGRPPKRPRPEVVYDEMGPVEPVAVSA